MFNFFKKNENSNKIPVIQEILPNNLILSKQSSIDLSQEHSNTLVIGCAGSGKTRYFVKPNLLQAHYSYIVTDCVGDCYETTADNFKELGYEVAVLDLYHPEKSAKYNPLEYVYTNEDAECLAKIMLGRHEEFESRFTYDVAVKLLSSLFLLSREIDEDTIFCLHDINAWLDDHKHTMTLFEKAGNKLATSAACKAYGDTGIQKQHFFESVAKAIKSKLAIFCEGKYKDIFCGKDELKLNRTSVKRVLYIFVPPFGEMSPIVSAVYAQAILTISMISGMWMAMGRPFNHKTVMFMDEFANTVYIPDFDVLVGKCKKHVCCIPVIQGIIQLQALYPKSWENILMEMDNTLFLGAVSASSIEYISKISNIGFAEIWESGFDKCTVIKRGKGGKIEDNYDLEQHPRMKTQKSDV